MANRAGLSFFRSKLFMFGGMAGLALLFSVGEMLNFQRVPGSKNFVMAFATALFEFKVLVRHNRLRQAKACRYSAKHEPCQNMKSNTTCH
jgi:hypothetical protein